MKNGDGFDHLIGVEYDRVAPDQPTCRLLAGTPEADDGMDARTGAFVTKTTENLMRAFAAGPAGHSEPVPKNNVAEVYAWRAYCCAMSNTSPVQSVDRAVSILELLAGRGELGITELATRLGVHKSTAFRLASALERRGLIEQARERGAYRLGFGLLRLAGAMSGQMELNQQGRPVCQRLADEVGETVNIAVLDGSSAVNIDQVLGRSSITTHNWVGQRTPLHATSSGKVLLAHLPEDRAVALIAEGLEAATPRTVTDPAALSEQLARARESGYAFTVEELEPGLNAVAAPIRGPGGRVIAAVSVSGPSFRLPEERIPAVAARVIAAATEISWSLP